MRKTQKNEFLLGQQKQYLCPSRDFLVGTPECSQHGAFGVQSCRKRISLMVASSGSLLTASHGQVLETGPPSLSPSFCLAYCFARVTWIHTDLQQCKLTLREALHKPDTVNTNCSFAQAFWEAWNSFTESLWCLFACWAETLQ